MDLNQAIAETVKELKTPMTQATTDDQIQDLQDKLVDGVRRKYSPRNDRVAYLGAILVLSLVLLGVAGIYLYLTVSPLKDPQGAVLIVDGKPVIREMPGELVAFGSAALGALAGLIAPSVMAK